MNRSAYASSSLGQWYLLQGLPAEAEKLLLIGYHAECALLLAEMRMMQGRLAEAQDYIGKAGSSWQNTRNAALLLGDICLIKGDGQGARARWCETGKQGFEGLPKLTITRHFIDPESLCSSDGQPGAVIGKMPFVGDFVTIAGLKSGTGKQLNG